MKTLAKIMDYKLIISFAFTLCFSTTVNASFRGLPIISSSPETGFEYGALVIQNLEEEAVDGKLSTIQYIAINSTKDQSRLLIRPTLYFFDHKVRFSPNIQYSSFPEKFYGVSNNALETNEEDFTSEYLTLDFELQYNFYSDLNIQIMRSIDDREITEFEPGLLIDNLLNTAGTDVSEYKLKSLGGALIWDSRDFPRYGSEGFYAAYSKENFDGGIYDYDESTLDLRAYHSLENKQVLAVQYLTIEQEGDIPFINLATIGGREVVRGIYEGKYRGPKMTAVQLEYRKYGYDFLNGEAGIHAFVSSGTIDSDETAALDDDKIHTAAGIGGHYFFNPEDKTTIRLDFAYGDEEMSFYLALDQAF